MKRRAMLFALLALCLALPRAMAEEAVVLSEAYRMMAGRVSFTFPTAPSLVLEADRTMEQSLERGGPYAAWTNKIQLAGETESGAEFRVHILNAEPMITWMKENHPGEEEAQYPFRGSTRYFSGRPCA